MSTSYFLLCEACKTRQDFASRTMSGPWIYFYAWDFVSKHCHHEQGVRIVSEHSDVLLSDYRCEDDLEEEPKE